MGLAQARQAQGNKKLAIIELKLRALTDIDHVFHGQGMQINKMLVYALTISLFSYALILTVQWMEGRIREVEQGPDGAIWLLEDGDGWTLIDTGYGDERTRSLWAGLLDGARAVVNLAGRSVDCRYTARNRRLIMDSRVDSTRVLGEAIALCRRPPSVWLNSSTATIYRHTFGPAWDESGETGATPEAKDAFSVEVAQAWERTLAGARTLALEVDFGRNYDLGDYCVWADARVVQR